MNIKICCNWNICNNKNIPPQYGELIISENTTTFFTHYKDITGNVEFIGESNNVKYKIFTLINLGYCEDGFFEYLVEKAITYTDNSFEEFQDRNFEKICSVCFELWGLNKWYNEDLFNIDEENSPIISVKHNKLEPFIIFSDEDIQISIETRLSTLPIDKKNISITMTNIPYIKIKYLKYADAYLMKVDIEMIFRFFAMLIGKLVYIDNIKFACINDEDYYNYYANFDLSYNRKKVCNKSRTTFEEISHNINNLFLKWSNFYFMPQNRVLLDHYFYLHNRSSLQTEYFLGCIKFLEGYSLRTTLDESKSKELKKKIKSKFQCKEISNIFTNIFIELGFEDNSKCVPEWIANGFLLDRNLGKRLLEIDKQFFQLISLNEDKVVSTASELSFIQRIVKTRNFYSHFKDDDKGILNNQEICDCIDVLLSTMTVVILYEMGFALENVKEIIKHDDMFSRYYHEKGELDEFNRSQKIP